MAHSVRLGGTALMLAGLWFGACSSDEPTSVPDEGAGGEGGTAGDEGSGGSGGEGGSDPGSGGSGAGTSSGGGAGTGSGGEGGSGGGVIATNCNGDRAFLAPDALFTPPTKVELLTALNSLTEEAAESPIGLVLRLEDGSGTLALSAFEKAEELYVFPANRKPKFTEATARYEGFTTSIEAPVSHLRLVDASGPVFLKLINVTVLADTVDDCTRFTATVSAEIPESEGDVELELESGTVSISELAGSEGGSGGRDTGGLGWPVSFTISAGKTEFDFSTL